MDVDWHPIKSETDLPPVNCGKDYWLTSQDVTTKETFLDKGWLSLDFSFKTLGWWIDNDCRAWNEVNPETNCRVIAWADYETPEPYEEEA